MAQIKFSNNATTTIALSITEVDTTLTVKAGDGAKFPTLTGDDYFIGTLVRGDGGTEIVKVTARTSDTLSIERAQEGSTALAFNANDVFELRLTAGSLETVINIPDASEAVKGLTQFATESEVEAVTEDAKAISPLNFGTYMANRTVATPSFSMPASAAEKTVVSGTYAVEVGATAAWSVPAAFVDFNDAGDGTFTFTAPTLDVDTSYDISMTANKTGKLTSQAVIHSITITNVPIQDGPTIVVADTTEGWPGATILDGDIVAPATSTGTNNTYQFVTAKPEVVQTSGNIDIVTASATSVTLKGRVAQNDTLVTDQGVAILGAVSESAEADVLPSMTSSTTSGYTITASSEGGTTDSEAWRAADGVTNSDWLSLAGPTTPVEYTIQFPSTTYVDGYSIFGASGITAAVANTISTWEVYGRKSGGTWVLIGSESSQVGWSANEKRTFSVTNTAVDELQLRIASAQSGTTWVAIGEVEVYAPTFTADITSAGFSTAPTTAIKATTSLKVGYGITDEYLGPEENLTIDPATTTSSIVLSSTASIKDKIYLSGGLHNNLLVDAVNVNITGTSETSVASTPTIISDQGTLVASESLDTPERNPFTNSIGDPSFWRSSDLGPSAVDAAYVGTDFGSDTTVAGFHIQQYGTPAVDNYSMTSIMVQKSSDGLVWTDVELVTITLQAGVGEYTLTSPDTARYWRLLAKSNSLCTSCTWGVVYTRWTEPAIVYTTTAVPSATLSQLPSTVVLPDRCTQAVAGYTYTTVGTDIKVTADKVTLVDNPNLKRLAMRVEGTGTTFDTGTIYTEEKL